MLALNMSDTVAPSHQNQDPNNEVFTETHLSAVSTSNAPLVILTSFETKQRMLPIRCH